MFGIICSEDELILYTVNQEEHIKLDKEELQHCSSFEYVILCCIKRGRENGIYNDIYACRRQVDGYSHHSFKRFSDYDSAKRYLQLNNHFFNDPRDSDKPIESICHVYIDGACRGNGTPNAAGGYGIFYSEGDDDNASVPLSKVDNARPTNQRAELFALRHALRDISRYTYRGSTVKFIIFTDSMYVKNCMEVWADKWEDNGWINSRGYTVANKDLIEECFDIYCDLMSSYISRGWGDLEIRHVPGHSGNEGNEMADTYAWNAATGDYEESSIYY